MGKKSKSITICTTAENYEKLKAKADKDRRPLAQFVGLIIEDYLEGVK